MALNSPGVQVSVIDESFYVPAEPGTNPLIIVTTQSNKTNGSGTGTAIGTLAANAGKPYLLTSTRDLSDIFGVPTFHVDSNNNPIHGSERNEYGLQAAYSYLGVSNSAWVVRSDLDLAELTPTTIAPNSNPIDGQYWLDTRDSQYGIFEWNGSDPTVSGGQKFTNKVPTVIIDSAQVDTDGIPLGSVGKVGDYAIVSVTSLNKIYYRTKSLINPWVELGSSNWVGSNATVQSIKTNPALVASETMSINGTTITVPANLDANLEGVAQEIRTAGIIGITAQVVNSRLEIYSTGVDVVIAKGTGTLIDNVKAADSRIGIKAGTYKTPKLSIQPHTSVPLYKKSDVTNGIPSGSVWIKTTNVNLGAHWIVKMWNGELKTWQTISAPVYASNQAAIYGLDRAGGGRNIPRGSIYVQFNVDESQNPIATFSLFRRELPSPTTLTSPIVIADGTFDTGTVYTIQLAETTVSSLALSATIDVTFTALGTAEDARLIASSITSKGFENIRATVNTRNQLVITHETGGEIRLNTLTELGYQVYDVNDNSGTANFYATPAGSALDYIVTNWKPLKAIASNTVPSEIPLDGKLWYDPSYSADIMVHNGTDWVGYLDLTSPYYSADAGTSTDPKGPFITATKPTTQSDGTDLVNGDVWIDTGDIDNYPAIYKYDGYNLKWIAVDTADQTTEDGILFADARYNTTGENSKDPGDIADLLYSNFIDFDAPDPDLYPRGMLLFNTRRSSNNVKRFVRNYIDINQDNIRQNNDSQNDYYPHRWVNESGNAENGRGLFGRFAQRKVVVKHLKALVDTNQSIRDQEIRKFNLIACPGYPELIQNMVGLNLDRKQTAFVIGDTPMRLKSDATSINDWGKNVKQVNDNGEDGIVTSDEYLGVYYPSGYTTDNIGNKIVVPASHMVLRSMALSDGVSFPWFAPAGTRRGKVSNATSIGYIDSETNEWQSISLNEGQRDTLYAISVNPITFLTGSGIVIFGQKTRAANSSSLDRINVARLVVYLRGQLSALAKPYIFEPNDKITRDELKSAAESIMLELVGQRGIYDYLVVCDESNNTPSRIDRNELYLDIAIEPTKSVEFIYIPLRLKNTGEIAGLGK